jgi:hypothetical protein
MANRNEKWTTGDARRCASTANKIAAEHLPPPFNTTASPEAVNRSLKRNLKRFWKHHSKGFCKMWAELSSTGKKNLLQACMANLPDNRTDMLKQGNSLADVILLSPEMNIQDLVSNGDHSLISLYNNWCNSELEDNVAHARALVDSVLKAGRFEKRRSKDYVMLVDLKSDIKAGQILTCKEKIAVEKFKEFEAMGIALQRDVFEVAKERVNKFLSMLALYADEYRTEVLGLDNFFVASPLRGCAQCGRTDTEKGTELRGCRECVNKTITLFCSKVSLQSLLRTLLLL